MEFLQNLNLLDVVFLIMIFILMISGVVFAFLNKKNISISLANLANSMGVLGTFIGIFNGLRNFNVDNIDGSVPMLLDGMKFAFVTSIAGMIASIVVKLVNSVVENLINKDNDEEIDNIEDLFNSMSSEIKQLNITLTNNQVQSDRTFAQLSELFGQNQKDLKFELESLNSSLNKKQEILIDEFRKFGNQMAQNNTDALIDALNGVIKDFNNKISEQFGENFKELNIAVTKLLDWQENYKNTIEITINQLKTTVDSIKNIDESLSNINDSSIKLIELSDSLDNVLNEVSSSQKDINHGLSTMIEVSDMAKESMPILDTYFERTNENILKAVNKLDSYTEDHIIKVNEYIDKLSKNILDVSKQINNDYKVFTDTLDYLSVNTSDTLKLSTEHIKSQCETLSKTNEELRAKLQTQLNEIYEETSKQIVKIVEEMEKIFADRTDKVNEMLEHELKESLNSLGTQLATLSGRFVEDYMPLTEKLKEVVNIAQGV